MPSPKEHDARPEAQRDRAQRDSQPRFSASSEDLQLAQRASSKRAAGKIPTPQEQAAVRRVRAAQEESLRIQYYKSIPKKHWIEMSGRQAKVLNEQATRYGIPLHGPTIDLYRVALWLHDFLAENGTKLLKAETDESLLEGEATPALEELRRVQCEIKKRELAQIDRELIRREEVNAVLVRVAAILRQGTEKLQKRFGPEAVDIFNEVLSQAEEEAYRLADGPEAGDQQIRQENGGQENTGQKDGGQKGGV